MDTLKTGTTVLWWQVVVVRQKLDPAGQGGKVGRTEIPIVKTELVASDSNPEEKTH